MMDISGILAWIPVGICFTKYGYSIATITGGSMEPTFNPGHTRGSSDKDTVLLEKWSVVLRRFRRGQVVTLWSPNDPYLLTAKRIIALQGDVVQPADGSSDPIRIPRGHCWVEGDSNEKTRDSNVYGPIPLALINARVSHIVWPMRRIRAVVNSHGKAEDRVLINEGK
ncbi:putative peptidase [Kockovaella imperatae]|uniref:Mitochondrial inner membrane protease subunit 2 n=1 Tax=Kockovaella imperatae TaxID=4999 RepID=A0A1Y1U863_9TREE|nr:putative peptidase [Kockovaella imperatae]ORX33734.1 putative peptidase [Kockovaella imperatae]